MYLESTTHAVVYKRFLYAADLVALAVGQLESRELSGRSCVWSEPSMVDAAAYEFAETAKYLEAGGLGLCGQVAKRCVICEPHDQDMQ